MTQKSNRDVTTDRLDKTLQNIKCDESAEKFIGEYTVGQYKSFADYFNSFVSQRELEIPDIITRSNISKNYIYNIINGRKNPSRDKIIALCIGAGMNVREINRALKIAELGVLYAKNERDARITIAVNKGIRNIVDINIILEKHGLEIIE
ncbi:MAG: helix-turn-helix transcriptional regulator [Firmicutes bacterium]|nr:helix-turn-helix transcriptional regulator [Bacillota bacterium]